WTGRIRTSDRDEYVRYALKTGGEDYTSTPGNLGFQILLRDLGDGTTEVSTVSLGSSMEDIRALAGEGPESARYYPEDDRYLRARPRPVEHHEVAAGDVRQLSSASA